MHERSMIGLALAAAVAAYLLLSVPSATADGGAPDAREAPRKYGLEYDYDANKKFKTRREAPGHAGKKNPAKNKHATKKPDTKTAPYVPGMERPVPERPDPYTVHREPRAEGK